MALHNVWRFGFAAAALAALLAGCSAQTAPLSLACEPTQRAIVRQVSVNGVTQPQLECSSAAPAVADVSPAGRTAVPVSYAVPAAAATAYSPAPMTDTAFVRTAYEPAVITRPVAPQRIASRPAARRVVSRPRRSVAKSAVIIGSSAGVGAGIGAAIGGKKGAGIGALVGGGGAALWDQLTRRE
jgi:hypothetical protein